MAVVGRGAAAGGRRRWCRACGWQAFVELDRAGLLEQVDHGVAVGAEAEPSPASGEQRGPGRCRRPRSRSVVGQRHTPVRCPVRVGDVRRSVRWVACTAVVRGPSTPCVAQQRGRRAAVHRQALLVLGGLLGEVDVQRSAVCGSPVHDGRHAVRPGRARTECSAAPTDGRRVPTCCRSAVDTFGPAVTGRRRRTAAAGRPAVSRPRRRSDSRCRAG